MTDLSLAARQVENKTSALEGELGPIEHAGGVSTEYSITEFIPKLGGWVNLPMLVKGQVGVDNIIRGNANDKQRGIAIERAIERVNEGQDLPAYSTLLEAENAAAFRSKAKDLFK